MLAGALASLARLAAALAVSATALAAHHTCLILASHRIVITAILAVLARIATVATSVGHFILRPAIFFTQVGRIQTSSRPVKDQDLLLCGSALQCLEQSGLPRR